MFGKQEMETRKVQYWITLNLVPDKLYFVS